MKRKRVSAAALRKKKYKRKLKVKDKQKMKCNADFFNECEYVKDGVCQLNLDERFDCCPRRIN